MPPKRRPRPPPTAAGARGDGSSGRDECHGMWPPTGTGALPHPPVSGDNRPHRRVPPLRHARPRIERGGYGLMLPPLLSHKAARFTESVIRGMSIEASKYRAVNLA